MADDVIAEARHDWLSSRIRLDDANVVSITREPGQVIMKFRVGHSCLIDMAITPNGAKLLADALLKAANK